MKTSDSEPPQNKDLDLQGQAKRPLHGDVEARFDQALTLLHQLRAEVSRGVDARQPLDAPTEAARWQELQREVRRFKQQLRLRKQELTELRAESARALQRAEQEAERLRTELFALQHSLDDQMGEARRPSGFIPSAGAQGNEEPVESGRRNRQDADTVRPQPRSKGES